MSSLRRPFFYGWVIVAVAFVTMGVGVNARTAFSLFFPPILDEFGWDRGVTAGAFSFGFFVAAFLGPLLGRLMDRYGPRVTLQIGVGLTGAGMLLAAYVTYPWQLYLALGVLVGAGSMCLGYTGQSLFLPNWFVRRRGLAMSIAFSGVGIGSIVLLPGLQAFIDYAGWRAASIAMGVLVLVMLAPLNLLVKRRPEDVGTGPDGDPPERTAPGAPAHDNIVDHAWVAIDWTLARALRTARFWWIAAGYASAMFAWYSVQVHQTRYLVDVGFSAAHAAWALGFVSFVAIPGQIALGHISDRVGREWVWTVGCAGFALCYAALLTMQVAASPALLWFMVISQGLLGYGVTSVFGAIPAEIFKGRDYGAIFGTLSGTAMLGGALGPWVTGALYDATGNYTIAFSVCLGCSVFSALAIWLAAPRQIRAVTGRIGRT